MGSIETVWGFCELKDKLKGVSASKINKAMGIELTAEIMPMEEYVKVCQDND